VKPSIPRTILAASFLLLSALVLPIALSAPASAGPFEDGLAAHENGDYARALRLWRPLADQGNADAQRNLGKMYRKGEGVPQDFSEAASRNYS
jgi:TPR repeat protein